MKCVEAETSVRPIYRSNRLIGSAHQTNPNIGSVLDQYRIGIGPVLDRYRISIGLVSDRYQIGIGLVSDRYPIGIGSDKYRLI